MISIRKDVFLFIQKYLSDLVSYDDDDNAYSLAFKIESDLNKSESDAKKYAVDIIYILMKLRLVEFLSGYVGRENITLDDYIFQLIELNSRGEKFGDWFFYYKPTKLCQEIINKYDLYDGYFDDSILNVGFHKTVYTALSEMNFEKDKEMSFLLPISNCFSRVELDMKNEPEIKFEK